MKLFAINILVFSQTLFATNSTGAAEVEHFSVTSSDQTDIYWGESDDLIEYLVIKLGDGREGMSFRIRDGVPIFIDAKEGSETKVGREGLIVFGRNIKRIGGIRILKADFTKWLVEFSSAEKGIDGEDDPLTSLFKWAVQNTQAAITIHLDS